MSRSTKSDYLLLFRGNVWDRGLSPAQIQKVVSDWMAWFERLKEEGKCIGGHPLEEEGKVVSGKQGAPLPTVLLRNRKKRSAVTSIFRSRTRMRRSKSPGNVPDLSMARSSRFARLRIPVRSGNARKNILLDNSPAPPRKQDGFGSTPTLACRDRPWPIAPHR